MPGSFLAIRLVWPAGHAAAPPPQYRLTHGGVTPTLHYHAGECFQPAWNVAPLSLFDRNHASRRGDWMRYGLPDLPTTERGSGLGYELGRRFSRRSDDPACAAQGDCVWLGFDPAMRR